MGRRNQRRELRKLREYKTEKMREKEKFLSCLGMLIIGDGKPFYRLSKWLPLIFPIMNINGTHK